MEFHRSAPFLPRLTEIKENVVKAFQELDSVNLSEKRLTLYLSVLTL